MCHKPQVLPLIFVIFVHLLCHRSSIYALEDASIRPTDYTSTHPVTCCKDRANFLFPWSQKTSCQSQCVRCYKREPSIRALARASSTHSFTCQSQCGESRKQKAHICRSIFWQRCAKNNTAYRHLMTLYQDKYAQDFSCLLFFVLIGFLAMKPPLTSKFLPYRVRRADKRCEPLCLYSYLLYTTSQNLNPKSSKKDKNIYPHTTGSFGVLS